MMEEIATKLAATIAVSVLVVSVIAIYSGEASRWAPHELQSAVLELSAHINAILSRKSESVELVPIPSPAGAGDLALYLYPEGVVGHASGYQVVAPFLSTVHLGPPVRGEIGAAALLSNDTVQGRLLLPNGGQVVLATVTCVVDGVPTLESFAYLP